MKEVEGGKGEVKIVEKGQTRCSGSKRDDASGEAFDKVGKMLGLGYPGGVAIDKRAATGDPRAVRCRARCRGATISTSASRAQDRGRDAARAPRAAEGQEMNDFCASFQTAVVDVLVRKSRRALVREGLSRWWSAAASRANRGLRAALAAAAAEDGFALHIPPPKYCTDNAAMIAARGHAAARARRARRPGSLGRSGLPLCGRGRLRTRTRRDGRMSGSRRSRGGARAAWAVREEVVGAEFSARPRGGRRIVAAARRARTTSWSRSAPGWAR
jgi:N6-L-threonylcarbamoyladenine synthase